MFSVRHLSAALATALLVPAAQAALVHRSTPYHSAPSVSLDNGLNVLGQIAVNGSHVAEFLGMPFAQPPIDDLRWKAPQPYVPSSNGTVLNATVMPPSCWQYTSVHPSLLINDEPQYMIGTAGKSEDCLTVSVWAPVDAVGSDKALPVLIWFYGGGFTTGGTDVAYQNPTKWIERSQSHIVVVFNYRLNIFGFPNAAGLTEQNLGLMDQRLAVEWTQQNIASFGGDAERLVIFGQSAGSMAVDLYNYAFPEDPIITGLIMDSGTAHLDLLVSTDISHSSFSLVAAGLGCGNQTDAAAELACMMEVSAEDIEDFVWHYQDNGTSPSIGFSPVVDEALVFSNYTLRGEMGAMADVPAIVGFNDNEGLFLTTYNTTNPDLVTALEYSYDYFWCPATKTSYERLAANRTTYRYYQTGNFTNISFRPYMGAFHGSELPLIFGTHGDYRGNSTAFEYASSHAMQDAYLAFISDPVNGLASVGWPAYEKAGGLIRQFADMTNYTAAHDTTLVGIETECGALGLA